MSLQKVKSNFNEQPEGVGINPYCVRTKPKVVNNQPIIILLKCFKKKIYLTFSGLLF
tara:strand:+ start:564 stop:734 length:171 start_codon:yes stop_codon:yes gene_type:complete